MQYEKIRVIACGILLWRLKQKTQHRQDAQGWEGDAT
jgi:hypothetical protein